MNHILKSNIPKTAIDIKTLATVQDGKSVHLLVLVSQSAIKVKSNNETYLNLTIADKTGSIDMPIWNNAEDLFEELPVGTAILIKGTKKTYQEKPQINMIEYHICDDCSPTDFMAKYTTPVKNLIIEFLSYVKKIKDERYIEFIKELFGIQLTDKLEVMDKERWNSFINCPAAVRHHGNKIHGLLLHTIGVLRSVDNMIGIHDDFDDIDTADAYDKDMLYFMAMAHDFCKIYEYKYDTAIAYNDDLYVDHGVLLIGELQYINRCLGSPFSHEEMSKMYFISLTHDGDYSKYKPNDRDKYPVEAKLLHAADMIDSQIVGEAEKVKV